MLGKGALILAIAGPIVFATSSSHLLKTPEIKFEEAITPLISAPTTKPISETKPIENTEQNIPKVEVESKEEQNDVIEKQEEAELKTKEPEIPVETLQSLEKEKPNSEIEIKTEESEVLKDLEPKPKEESVESTSINPLIKEIPEPNPEEQKSKKEEDVDSNVVTPEKTLKPEEEIIVKDSSKQTIEEPKKIPESNPKLEEVVTSKEVVDETPKKLEVDHKSNKQKPEETIKTTDDSLKKKPKSNVPTSKPIATKPQTIKPKAKTNPKISPASFARSNGKGRARMISEINKRLMATRSRVYKPGIARAKRI